MHSAGGAATQPQFLTRVGSGMVAVLLLVSPTSAQTHDTATFSVARFSNTNGATDHDWIGVGIAETIAVDLTSVSHMRLLEGAPSNGSGAPEWAVSGDYELLGSRLRITARITSVGTDAVLHSVQVDGAQAELFALQDEVAAELRMRIADGVAAEITADDVPADIRPDDVALDIPTDIRTEDVIARIPVDDVAVDIPTVIAPPLRRHPGDTFTIGTFVNMTGESGDDWIGTAIAETIAVDLTSDSDEPIAQLDSAHASEARWVVTGDYARNGSSLRIAARMVEASTGTTFLSVQVDGEMAELFALQDRSAAALQAGLAGPVGPETTPHARPEPAVTVSAPDLVHLVPTMADVPSVAPPPLMPGTLQVTLRAPDTELRVGGGPYVVPIAISGALRLSTISITVRFDPAVLRVRSLTEGTFMRQRGSMVQFDQHVDEGIGRIDVVASRFNDTDGATGDGLLAVVHLDPLGSGEATLTLSGTALDQARTPVALGFGPMTLTVE